MSKWHALLMQRACRYVSCGSRMAPTIRPAPSTWDINLDRSRRLTILLPLDIKIRNRPVTSRVGFVKSLPFLPDPWKSIRPTRTSPKMWPVEIAVWRGAQRLRWEDFTAGLYERLAASSGYDLPDIDLRSHSSSTEVSFKRSNICVPLRGTSEIGRSGYIFRVNCSRLFGTSDSIFRTVLAKNSVYHDFCFASTAMISGVSISWYRVYRQGT